MHKYAREREREGQRERGGQRERETEGQRESKKNKKMRDIAHHLETLKL